MNRFERTRKDHRQETAEDYVELVYQLIKETGEARVAVIADRLGVSQVTVSQTLKRLHRDGLVIAEPYREVLLTEEGREMAQASLERHRIVHSFLLALGVSERTAANDAEGIEHHVSQETLARMDAFTAERTAKK